MKLHTIANNAAIIENNNILTLYSYGQALTTYSTISGIYRAIAPPKSKTSKKHIKLFNSFINLYKNTF